MNKRQDRAAALHQLAELLRQAYPLATFVNSDQCRPADRARLRELVGPKDFFLLPTTLNQLSREGARQWYRDRGEPWP